MGDDIRISQSVSLGANATQIGFQYNCTGLSPEDAARMAFNFFRDYYPQLRQELLADLEKMVEEKLKHIPTANIIPPTPRIAVPALQNASITEEQDIRELYAKLLANSMDKTMSNKVHPGYIEIIKQLCSDEVKILDNIFKIVFAHVITIRETRKDGLGSFDILRAFSNIAEIAGCETPSLVTAYLDNLIRLGLLENPRFTALSPSFIEQSLKDHPTVLKVVDDTKNKMGPHHQIQFLEGSIALTDYGKNFCRYCVQ